MYNIKDRVKDLIKHEKSKEKLGICYNKENIKKLKKILKNLQSAKTDEDFVKAVKEYSRILKDNY
jgi:uncharacterized protein YacL (UPF0231 family)